MPSRQTLTKLGEVVASLRERPPTWTYEELPRWVKVSGGGYLLGDFKYDARNKGHYEIESALSVIRNVETNVGWNEQRAALHQLIDELIDDPRPDRLRDAIPTLNYDEVGVIKLLQAGLDRRDPDRWTVRKTHWNILISRNRRRRIELSDDDRGGLAQPLGLGERGYGRTAPTSVSACVLTTIGENTPIDAGAGSRRSRDTTTPTRGSLAAGFRPARFTPTACESPPRRRARPCQ